MQYEDIQGFCARQRRFAETEHIHQGRQRTTRTTFTLHTPSLPATMRQVHYFGASTHSLQCDDISTFRRRKNVNAGLFLVEEYIHIVYSGVCKHPRPGQEFQGGHEGYGSFLSICGHQCLFLVM